MAAADATTAGPGELSQESAAIRPPATRTLESAVRRPTTDSTAFDALDNAAELEMAASLGLSLSILQKAPGKTA